MVSRLSLDYPLSKINVGHVSDITRLLSEVRHGDADAASQLLNLIQLELRQIAGRIWGDWPPGQTLQPTLLLDMAWERLVGFDGDLKKIVPTTFLTGDIIQPSTFVSRLNDPTNAVSGFITAQLGEPARRALAGGETPTGISTGLEAALIQHLNTIIKGPVIYEDGRFAAVDLRPETRLMLARKQHAEKGCGRLNRLLLEDAYPEELSRELHKEQFLRFAAVTMKRILWEARERKKGRPPMDGGDALANLDLAGSDEPADRLMAVQDAVDELVAAHPQAGRLVKLLCYEGRTIPEAAQEMNLTLITAKRRWEFAKAWLYNKLKAPVFS